MSNPYETAKAKKASVLGPTLRFKGELTADEDLLIQGRIEGSIKHSSNLTVGEEGQVKANISAEYIAVEGKVNGDLSGSQSVTVRDSADIQGNIYSPVVTLLEGATFNGKIDMTGRMAPEVAEPPVEQKTTKADAAADDRPAKADAAAGDRPATGSTPPAAKKKSQSRPNKKSANAA